MSDMSSSAILMRQAHGSRATCQDQPANRRVHRNKKQCPTREATSPDQRLTNDTTQPNKNKRRQTRSNATLIIRFYRLFRGGRTAHNGLVGGSSPPGPTTHSSQSPKSLTQVQRPRTGGLL